MSKLIDALKTSYEKAQEIYTEEAKRILDAKKDLIEKGLLKAAESGRPYVNVNEDLQIRIHSKTATLLGKLLAEEFGVKVHSSNFNGLILYGWGSWTP